MANLSPNAEKALLFQYILEKGLPDWCADYTTTQIKVFMRITGLGEAEAIAAWAELEDADMVDREASCDRLKAVTEIRGKGAGDIVRSICTDERFATAR